MENETGNVKEVVLNGNTNNVNQEKPKFGLSVIEVNKDKIPKRAWAEYQKHENPIENWHQHFLKDGYIGIITGKVSGNLEVLDFDLKNDPEKTIYEDFVNLLPVELINLLVKQTTVNGGYHLIYRCPDKIEGNLKLAKHTNGEVIIETRGEGGYICHHLTDYKVVNGHFDMRKLEYDIPEISADEREMLLVAARTLNREEPKKTKSNYNEPAITRFNQEFNILDLFEQNGWEIVREDESKYYLNRPGSSTAHSGYYYKDSKSFICFSSSTQFRVSQAYNHFQVLQVLENIADYKALLKRISEFGFQPEVPTNQTRGTSNKISAEDIAQWLNDTAVRYDTFIQDLTLNGDVITEIEYNTLSIDLKKHFNTEVARTKFEEVIKSLYIKQFNPILDFVEKNQGNDSTGNFEKWVECLTLKNKTVKTSTFIHFFKKWYVGLIAQALDGKFPNEFFLSILSTQQGIGKSTLLRTYTLPKELHKYIMEHQLSFDDDFKVIMGQALLIVDDEMDGRTYEAEKSFKSLLSTMEQTTRRKYDRRISNIKRRASFAGSGNNLFVVKEKQNRRILPIEVEKIDYKKLDELDLTALFMEAYNLFKAGFKYSYEFSDTERLDELFEDYKQISDLDLIFDELIDKPNDEADIFFITSLDTLKAMFEKYGKLSKMINAKSIGNQMIDRKFQISRKGVKKTTCYSISKTSSVIGHLESDSQSWRFNPRLSKETSKLDDVF
jgi:hypothetical protein